MAYVWMFRVALVITFVLGLIVSAGCTPMPTMRVKVVRLGAKPKADIAYRWKGCEVVVVIDVESVIPAPVE